MNFFLIFITLTSIACNSQNSVTTNEIIKTKNHLFGVQSENGNLLIDTIYRRIRVLYDNSKLTLPPKRKSQNPIEYYLVSDTNRKYAIFDKDGKIVFDFIDCLELQFDEYTQSVITIIKEPDNRQRSYLYNIKGELQFKTTFQHVGFINNSDLIALIVEDGQNDEFYLYNPFTKKKLGPFDHFNIYNEDISPVGMNELDFEKYKKLNLVKVRREVDNDYIWGVIDSKGIEILPMEYRNLEMFSEQHKSHPAFKKAVKPEGVDFIFKGAHISKPSTSIYFDNNFVKYEFKSSVIKGEYRIEKM